MNDAETIEKCCAYDPEDTPIGNNIASDFLNYQTYLNSSSNTTLGLVVGNHLAGLAQANANNELGIAVINIFVNRCYRNNGYAKRLLSAICAISEEITYCYSCIKSNIASINTAKACEFEFKGAYLLL